jgi:mRNA interferase YafQ
MSLEIIFSKQFRKDRKKFISSGRILDKLNYIISRLMSGLKPEAKFKDHLLKGNFQGFRECHIEPDCLLIYKIEDNTIILGRLGSHSELF